VTRKTLAWIGIILCIFWALLIWFVWSGHADTFDIPLREAFLALSPPNASHAWRLITYLGSVNVITVLSVVCVTLLIARADWKTAWQFTFNMVGAMIIENGLKLIVHRGRPAEVFAHTMPSTYSFPSGHALFSLAFYGSVAMIAARQFNLPGQVAVWLAAVLFIFLIGASRIFLGVHYPTDVLGGYSAALLWMIMVQLILKD
jgi:membrane-associated phospholipid phosphatase